MKEKSANRAHARLSSPVERAFVRLKDWRIFRKVGVSPNRLTSAIKAILTLENAAALRCVSPARAGTVSLFNPCSKQPA
ncbi:hypothetical protein ACFWIB_42100 [Streptomyces sp. NPDC127051]|uniref:hypothetical protein n=1 Tax=Streptomyces sp. NPDC127051 TaxID=3347119 RepID=UPI003649D5C2